MTSRRGRDEIPPRDKDRVRYHFVGDRRWRELGEKLHSRRGRDEDDAADYYRRDIEQDYEEEEEWYAGPPIDWGRQLVKLLQRVERWRNMLHLASGDLESILKRRPEVRKKWDEFQAIGGFTAHDFQRFLDGKIIRHRRKSVQKKHMRLVSTGKPVIKRVRRFDPDGDEAA
jgi:hypothetical protein